MCLSCQKEVRQRLGASLRIGRVATSDARFTITLQV
jgi:hypothetical protein